MRGFSSGCPEAQKAISNSISKLRWDGKSLSFDKADIVNTRPGFGIIVMLKKNQFIHKLRDQLSPQLLLKTRDNAMHMTVFQVFLMFGKDYAPDSIPPNLLKVFKEYMDVQLKHLIEEVDASLQNTSVKLVNEYMLLGKDLPSHLVIRVKCEGVDNILKKLKDRANEVGSAWMTELAKVMSSKKLGGEAKTTPVGMNVSGNGWTLILAYTANKDYKTHVTLGQLPTGNPNLDRLIKKQHVQNLDRTIDLEFSSEPGSQELNELSKQIAEATSSFRIKKLKELELVEEQMKMYPSLAEQAKNAKAGKEVRFVKDVIDEWGKVSLTTLKLPEIPESDRTAYVSGIHGSIINMDRIQNFEEAGC